MLATPAIHATAPSVVAWQMKTLANKNLKFQGETIRVTTMTCQARGGSLFVCLARFSDGEKIYWPTVTYKNGTLKASGGVSA